MSGAAGRLPRRGIHVGPTVVLNAEPNRWPVETELRIATSPRCALNIRGIATLNVEDYAAKGGLH
jgi:hypothetical protein